MSYKRPFSAMERDSLSGSAEHDDSIWIQRKDRYREINREVPYVTPVRKEILTEELSKRYPLFKTKTFGQESREIAVNYILHNNEHYGLKPFAVSKTVDSLLRENNQFKCKVAQNYFREYDKYRLDHTYTKDSFALVKNCPMQDQEPLLACAPVSFYPPRPSAMPRPSSVAPARRASVLPAWIWSVWKLALFSLLMVSMVYGFLYLYQDAPDVWHSQVPRLLFRQIEWRSYNVDLWMGMAAYYCSCYHVALRKFENYHLAILKDWRNPYQLENKFTASVWICKSFIQIGNFFDLDHYCEEPVVYMKLSKILSVSVQYDCLYTSAFGVVRFAEKTKSMKFMNIAHQWVIQTKTLLGYYTTEAQDLLEQSDPFQFQSKLNKMNEERIQKETEEKKRLEEQIKAYEDMYERFRREDEEERILEEKSFVHGLS